MADDEREEHITDLSMQRTREAREARVDFLEAERADRATNLEEERVLRATSLEDQREHRAANLEYQRGRREARVDAELLAHKQRLDTINGSIATSARNVAALKETLVQSHETITDKIDGLIAAQATRDAIAADRAARLDKVSKNQLDSRTFKVGVAGVIVVLIGVMLSLLVAVHVI